MKKASLKSISAESGYTFQVVNRRGEKGIRYALAAHLFWATLFSAWVNIDGGVLRWVITY